MVLEPFEGSPEDGGSPDILFLEVPEAMTVKNRLHLDLRPVDQARHARRGGPAVRLFLHVLRDPEGNELCVLRPLTPTSCGQRPSHSAATDASSFLRTSSIRS